MSAGAADAVGMPETGPTAAVGSSKGSGNVCVVSMAHTLRGARCHLLDRALPRPCRRLARAKRMGGAHMIPLANPRAPAAPLSAALYESLSRPAAAPAGGRALWLRFTAL